VRELWTKSRWIVIGAAGIALAAWAYSALGTAELPDEPLALAPEGSTLVARIAVATVTRSHLYEALLEDESDDPGVRRIERMCGYDPLEQIDEAVVFVGGPRERPFEHLGFVARGEMARGRENKTRLVECVREVISEDGGGLREVEVEGERAVASASGSSHAAFIGSDGVVGGDREVVAQAIRVARGDAPSAAQDRMLARLWERVATDRDLVVVGRLPRRWLPIIERFTGELEGDFDALSGVRALGIGARVRGGLSIGLAAEAAQGSDAERLVDAVNTQIDRLLEDRLVRLSAVGTALRRVSAESQGREAVITVSLSNDQVDDLLELWRDLRRQREEAPAAPEPDETIEGGEGEAGAESEPEPEPEPESESESESEPESESESESESGGRGRRPSLRPRPGPSPASDSEPEPESAPEPEPSARGPRATG
jgi:hypothetical protein